jgi:hypothetical protein
MPASAGGGGCTTKGGGRGDSLKWRGNHGDVKDGGTTTFFNDGDTPMGGGGDGVALQHTIDVGRVRHRQKWVESRGGDAHREMALGCDGGRCSVSTTFVPMKEAKWRSARRLRCAKIEGEMGEQQPRHGALRKEGGRGVDRRVELRRRGASTTGNGRA